MLTEHDRSSLVEGLWWVWLGGTQNHFWFKHVVGLAHCWVLRRHPGWCFFGAASWSGCPNASRCGVGVVVPVGLGVWWCVECCI